MQIIVSKQDNGNGNGYGGLFFFPLKKSNGQSKCACVCVCVSLNMKQAAHSKRQGKQCLDTEESARKTITTESLGVEHETDPKPFKV